MEENALRTYGDEDAHQKLLLHKYAVSHIAWFIQRACSLVSKTGEGSKPTPTSFMLRRRGIETMFHCIAEPEVYLSAAMKRIRHTPAQSTGDFPDYDLVVETAADERAG